MAQEGLPTTAFGEADLSTCEREQIHLAASIQPHGALLVVREPELVVVQASANAARFLGIDGEVLVRADPVFSEPECVLGFVVAVTDLIERKTADAARRRFQEAIVTHGRLTTGLLDSRMGLLHKDLLSSIIENAQLAALEITDGVEVGQMPGLLESVQSSIDRSEELLRHLIRRAAAGTKS